MRKNLSGENMDAQARLEQLGYKQELVRALSPAENVIMALSNASPVMAAFVFGLAPFVVAGTTSVISAILQGVVVLLIGCVLAELGSIYPVSGGLYSIASYVLPKPLTYVALLMFMLQALIFPPSIALGTATYIQILFPALPQSALATSVIAAVTTLIALLIGLNSIATSNLVTKILMAIQAMVIAIFVIACLTNPQRGILEVLSNPQMLNAAQDSLVPPSFGTIFMTAGMMFAVVNGYDASLGFSEETKGNCRQVGRTVLISAILVSVLVVSIFWMAVISAPNLIDFLKAPSPLLYSAEAAMGRFAAIIVNVGVLISSFSGLVVIIVYMSRTIYTGGRDGVFPPAVNRAVMKLSEKSQIPWVSTAVLAIVTIVLVFASDLVALITFGSILTATVYLLISFGSISSRMKEPALARPFRMPLFPLTPILAIAGLLIALGCQTKTDIGIGLVLVVLALLYYYAYIRPRDRKTKETVK